MRINTNLKLFNVTKNIFESNKFIRYQRSLADNFIAEFSLSYLRPDMFNIGEKFANFLKRLDSERFELINFDYLDSH